MYKKVHHKISSGIQEGIRQRCFNIRYKGVFTGILLSILNFTAAGQIQFVQPASFRLLSVAPQNNVPFTLQVTPPVNKTIAQVYLRIGGADLAAMGMASGQYTVNWTSSAFGTFPCRGFVLYSDNSKDSTDQFSYKLIQSTVCGAMTYNNTAGYLNNDTVATATDSVFRRVSYWAQGDYPSFTNANWVYLGQCNSNLYTTFDCDNIGQWSGSSTYATTNTLVHYNGAVYSNNYYAQGDIPDNSPAWKKKGACMIQNKLPLIGGVYSSDTTIVMNPLGTVSLSVAITDIDGSIVSTVFQIDGNPVVFTMSSGNYVYSYTPASYGNHTLTITATDDEHATSTKTITLRVMPSMPPVITAVLPVQGQVINTIANLGTSPLQLSASVTDPDNGIASVTFSIDGTIPIMASGNSGSYTASWTPAAYGAHQLAIKATDVAGAFSEKAIDFTLENPNSQQLAFATLPLQLKLNLGYTKTFTLDSSIQSVIARNESLARIEVNGNALVVTGKRTGRTGLKITTTSGAVYFVGLSVKNSDGTAPGLPAYASLGFVSENSTTDNGFWEDMDTDLTNKNSDVRYIYINDGPIGNCNGCNTWRDSTRHINYCKSSLKYGLTPFFVYYNIPNGGESFETDLEHAQDTSYMKAYFKDLSDFVRQCHEVMGGELFGIILEPDFLGYMQQLGVVNVGTNNPDSIRTCVTANDISYNSGTIHTLVQRINKTISDRRIMGANIYFGWQMNLWSDGTTAGSNGIMRTTDGNWSGGRTNVVNGATNVANYLVSAGVLTHGADFISMDKYGLDAGSVGGFNSTYAWWFNNDHWDNYMLYAKTVHQVSGKPIILWQLPVGRINNTTSVSAYTGSTFPVLPNTTTKYEDPTATYFFGDKFLVPDAAKRSYLSNNNAGDTTLKVLGGDTLQWGSHIDKFLASGIIHAMFGAGVGISTNGIHDNACQTCGPTDNYFLIQKMQEYYKNNISWIDTSVFTPTILSYAKSDTLPKSLRCKLGNETYMYYGYNNAAVSDTGYFVPANLSMGLHYISFVTGSGPGASWKVQRLMVRDNVTSVDMVKLPANGTNITAVASCDPPVNAWIYYRDPSDDKYVLAINPNGNAWNPVSVSLVTDNTPFRNADSTLGISKRYIIIDAPGSFNINGGLKMRLYFSPGDTTALIPGSVNYSNWYKFNGLGPGAVHNAVSGSMLANSSSPAVETYGTEQGIAYVQFQGLTSFSTFGYLQSTNGTPLDTKLFDFAAEAMPDGQVRLRWQVSKDSETDHFGIYRSDKAGAAPLMRLGDRKNAKDTERYTYFDAHPLPGINLYRLSIVGKNGSLSWSKTVPVALAGSTGGRIKVFPNPTDELLNIIVDVDMAAGPAYIDLYDVSGISLFHKRVTERAINLDMSSFPAGPYMLRLIHSSGEERVKIIKSPKK